MHTWRAAGARVICKPTAQPHVYAQQLTSRRKLKQIKLKQKRGPGDKRRQQVHTRTYLSRHLMKCETRRVEVA